MMGHQELTTNFPAGLVGADAARTALDRALALATTATTVHEIVQAQAVAALLRQELSIRQIAEHLALSKSSVGRIARQRSGGEFGFAVRSQQTNQIKTQITEIWGL